MMIPGGTGTSQGGAPATEDDNKLIDLSVKFDKSDCYAINESSQYPMQNLFIGDTRLGCKSDTDEQLILHLAFIEFVKVSEYNERTVVVYWSVIGNDKNVVLLISPIQYEAFNH